LVGPNELQEKIKADFALPGMRLMSYDLVNIGPEDFNFGQSFVLDNSTQYDFPVINANIVYEQSGEHILEPYRIIHSGNVRFGFIGIASMEDTDGIQQAAEMPGAGRLIVSDEAEALQTQISAIAGKVDIIVVMAATGIEKALELAEQVPGVDLIVCSGGSQITEQAYWADGVYILKAGYEGKTIGRVTLAVDSSRKLSGVDMSVVSLDKTYADDDAVKDLIDQYHQKLEDLADELLDIEQQDPASGGAYVGAAECSGCHGEQAAQWETTRHSIAFESLEDDGQEYNKECIGCHVTGFGYTGGFEKPAETPEMADVQCEMCHGAAGEHLLTGLKPSGVISEQTCLACHDPANSPDFDYDTYYEKIKH